MEPHGYFPNGNPDHETPWKQERNIGWMFFATAIIGLLIHHYWLTYDFILAISFSLWGLSVGLIRLGTRGQNQAIDLQEREGEIDWALDKLRENNIDY